jgi:ABC-2 type transport system ATP-binding protein
MEKQDSSRDAILVRDLTKRFGAFTAVNKINFSIKQGEIFGFLGPNGAGKSTTIRMLCGLLKPTSGSVMVLGHDTARHSLELRSDIGYMSQRFSLYEDLTAEENVDLFAGLYGLPRSRRQQRKEWALATADLSERRSTLTRNLSGGHRQRLALSCSLIHEPKLLFLDEPTSGVDPVTRRNFWSIVGELAERGVTIMVTTHHMDEAEQCDRLALIYRGKIVAMETPQCLKDMRMQGEILKVEAEPLMDALALLEKTTICRECSLFGSTIHAYVDSAEEAIGILKDTLEERGIKVKDISVTAATLEDVFISLIEEEDRKEEREL